MKTVVVVDDEFGLAESLAALLRDEGYRVFTAVNGRQALDRMDETKPDLMLLDYMMPVLNGAATLKELRASPAWNRLPVILMSGAAEAQVRERCEGYDAFLRKPFDADRLLELLASLTAQAR